MREKTALELLINDPDILADPVKRRVQKKTSSLREFYNFHHNLHSKKACNYLNNFRRLPIKQFHGLEIPRHRKTRQTDTGDYWQSILYPHSAWGIKVKPTTEQGERESVCRSLGCHSTLVFRSG